MTGQMIFEKCEPPDVEVVRARLRGPDRVSKGEHALCTLLTNPGVWFVVDCWDRHEIGAVSKTAAFLRRRGADVTIRKVAAGSTVCAYARWTHD